MHPQAQESSKLLQLQLLALESLMLLQPQLLALEILRLLRPQLLILERQKLLQHLLQPLESFRFQKPLTQLPINKKLRSHSQSLTQFLMISQQILAQSQMRMIKPLELVLSQQRKSQQKLSQQRLSQQRQVPKSLTKLRIQPKQLKNNAQRQLLTE